SGILDKNVSLIDTLCALALLIFMQFLITRSSVKFRKIDKLVKANPVMLFYQGELLQDAMEHERVGRDEILACMRENGLSTLSQVEAIVLETNGKLSAIPKRISDIETLDHDKSYSDVSHP